MQDNQKLVEKINSVLPFLNEAQKRIYLASEVLYLGRGGKIKLEKLIGVSHNTINKGIRDLKSDVPISNTTKLRKKGGGRKQKVDDGIWGKIKDFISPHTRGEPESPLLWVSKSLRNIEKALKTEGITVSHRIIGDALKRNGFSLQANRKTFEGKGHKDRDAQFEFINRKVQEYHFENQPAISVDAKKRELIGNYKNNGQEWCEKKSPEKVNAYDFLTDAEGVAIPYGILDMFNNKGWVNVGITKDTAEFAVQSIRNWWYKMGIYYNNKATSLLITADGGGSNSSKGKLWKFELQKLANETRLKIEVVHFPPGTSKWNKIEHRLFSYISKNWRGKPLISYEVIIKLIASTKTNTGLDVECEIDTNDYKTGIKIKKKQEREIEIVRSSFHGEWNYSIYPQ
ncbi:MAG: ISAzo13 family transposase [Bacteroidota bacterium]|nr:ISAzo13 family transposase [Bacteroidota bacterium]